MRTNISGMGPSFQNNGTILPTSIDMGNLISHTGGQTQTTYSDSDFIRYFGWRNINHNLIALRKKMAEAFKDLPSATWNILGTVSTAYTVFAPSMGSVKDIVVLIFTCIFLTIKAVGYGITIYSRWLDVKKKRFEFDDYVLNKMEERQAKITS